MSAPAGYDSGEATPQPFSLNRSRCAVLTDPNLRAEILVHTRSEVETTSILRSIGRFGDDHTVRYFDVTPVPRRGTHRIAPAAWTVSAVR